MYNFRQLEIPHFFIKWCSSTFIGFIQLRKYSKEWDEELNRLIDSHKQVSRGYCVLIIDNTEVWVDNKFYAYGHRFVGDHVKEFRPSMKTMFKLWKLEKQISGDLRK